MREDIIHFEVGEHLDSLVGALEKAGFPRADWVGKLGTKHLVLFSFQHWYGVSEYKSEIAYGRCFRWPEEGLPPQVFEWANNLSGEKKS